MKYFQQPPSQQQHFQSQPAAEIERSRFDRSHSYKTTMDSGVLVPIFVDEVLPGDTFDLKATSFARLSTPLKPVMDNMYFETFFFFVPNRLVWDNWQRFCGERTNPTDDPSLLTMPKLSIAMDDPDLAEKISSYFGLPQGPKNPGSVLTVNALPFRAYHLIWNEWFRDQNLQAPAAITTGDSGDSNLTNSFCQPRGKRHDYFTSALPWPQKGEPVMIPITGAPVMKSGSGVPQVYPASATANVNSLQITTTGAVVKAGTPPGVQSDLVWNNPRLEVELEGALAGGGATINDLRAAFQIQRLLERDARGGTRYRELLLAHFGVSNDDLRLQRPEVLSSSSDRINITPVPATFHNAEVAQGDLAGVGTVVGRGGFSKSFTEHGFIIGLANVRADLTYQEGVDRMWTRTTRYDHYWPALAHLGEQAILNKEIFLTLDGGATDDTIWGYQERYAEYRYKLSRITGRFSSFHPQSLDVWHLAQDFASLPLLNDSFIMDKPPIERIVAVPTEPQFLVDVWFSLQCARPLPVYGVPGMVDHF